MTKWNQFLPDDYVKKMIHKSPRNPSRNTVKKIMRRAFLAGIWEQDPWNEDDDQNYFLYNQIGAVLYRMSKGKICNIEPKGFDRYLTPKQVEKMNKIHKSLGAESPIKDN